MIYLFFLIIINIDCNYIKICDLKTAKVVEVAEKKDILSDQDLAFLRREIAVNEKAILKYKDDNYLSKALKNLMRYNELLKNIIHGKGIDIRDEFGWTALFHAYEVNNFKMMEILLKRGATPNVIETCPNLLFPARRKCVSLVACSIMRKDIKALRVGIIAQSKRQGYI